LKRVSAAQALVERLSVGPSHRLNFCGLARARRDEKVVTASVLGDNRRFRAGTDTVAACITWHIIGGFAA
jgi:hypothetical protein